MSHEVDEVYSVYDKTVRRARKAHTCSACRLTIQPGERYMDVLIIFDGMAETVKRCGRCETIHAHLAELGDGELWPDERLSCGEDYREEWGKEPPEAIQALVFATSAEASAALEHAQGIHQVNPTW